MKRQSVRKLVLLVSLLLFPVTMWYFSPAIIIMGMAQHILTGSFFTFLLMLILSMFLGRSFCGYLCPAGVLQECAAYVNSNPAKQGKRRAIKYVIWTIWIAVIVIAFALGEGTVGVDVFYMTDHGVSVTEIANYAVYYAVILLLLLPSLIHGRRAACHYICWMAPFMVIGEKIGQILHIPQLHVSADNRKCISCKKCETVCPMGLKVEQMIKENNHCQCIDCIQCGACVDSCPKNVLSYSWKEERRV
ncbi:MAG: 4Fe-4S binding protein [Clostridiaceae bacterium]|nr:4Fe-4S binding protein [Clostridiaceae bacterium]